MRAVTVEGIDIVVALDADGKAHALHDRCAHSGARLSKGRLLERIDGHDVDEYELTNELVLRCPWHGYEYELASGRCLADPTRVRVRAYPLTVEDGIIYLERGKAGAA